MPFNLQQAVAGQKALGAHPGFMRPEPYSVYSPGKTSERPLMSQREAIGAMQTYGGSQAVDWLFDCINLYADPISTAPYRLEKPDGTKLVRAKNDGTPPDYKEGPQDLYDLLDKPNPFQLYDELLALTVIDLFLAGNHYWYLYQRDAAGKPAAIYRLAPSAVKLIPGQYGPTGYRYQPAGVSEPLRIGLDEMIHFRRPNPHNQFFGMGVIQGSGRAMDLELAVTDTMASYYANKANPSMIVQSDRRVPRDVFNKLRAQLRARLSGSGRSGELLVLESGLKASTLSANAADALFNEISKMSRDRIFTKFRASPLLFGQLADAGGNKVDDARRDFDVYALVPFITKLQNLISSVLVDLWGVKFEIDHEYQLPPETALKVGGEIARVPGVKVREVRRQYRQFGIEESTGDPKIDEMVMNVPGENLGPTGQGVNGGPGQPDQPLPGEPGAPARVDNTQTFQNVAPPVKGPAVRSGKALTIDEIEERLSALGAGKAIPSDSRLPGEKRPDDSFAVARKADIDAATLTILAGLRKAATTLERELLDHVEGKALKTSDLVQRIRRSDAWDTFRRAVEAVLSDGTHQAASSGVMHTGLAPEEDVDYDEIVASIIHRPDGLRSVIATLKDRVVNGIKEARAANAERAELQQSVRESISQWSDAQALTVADDMATQAYNEATLTVSELSGATDVYVTDGVEHDEACIEADGSIWPIEKARENRTAHPRCRRAFLAIGAVT